MASNSQPSNNHLLMSILFPLLPQGPRGRSGRPGRGGKPGMPVSSAIGLIHLTQQWFNLRFQ